MESNNTLYPIDNFILETEKGLSRSAAMPIIGTFSGIAKITMGSVQMVASVAITILLLLPSLFFKAPRKILTKSVEHIVHGVLNILAGGLEGIPGMGFLIFKYLRQRGLDKDKFSYTTQGSLNFKYTEKKSKNLTTSN